MKAQVYARASVYVLMFALDLREGRLRKSLCAVNCLSKVGHNPAAAVYR